MSEYPEVVTSLADFLLARIGEDEAAAKAADSATALRWEMAGDAVRHIIEVRDQLNDTELDAVLQSYAALYAGHPDYCDEWRG